MPKRTAGPPKENMKSTKPLVIIPVDQLQDLGAAEDKELPDLSLDYFQELEDIFATFADGPSTIENLRDLIEQSIIVNNFSKIICFNNYVLFFSITFS